MSAPKVTPQDIENNVASLNYLNLGDALERVGQPAPEAAFRITLCLLTTTNGYGIVGKSACVDIKNYDKALGESVALADAKEQMWPLMGYALKERLQFVENEGNPNAFR